MIVTLGLVGNSLSICVFSRKTMQKHTTFRYLLALSVVDMCVVVSGAGDTLLQAYTNESVRLLNGHSCKLHSFMIYVLTHTSSMLLACMSVDRALVISVERGATLGKKLCKSVTKMVLVVSCLVALLNSHFLLFPRVVDVPAGRKATVYNNNETSLVYSNNISHANLTTAIKMRKMCYDYDGTLYFYYLTKISPW
jgi:hypothetical protein